MNRSQRSAVIFVNIMMVLFYASIFGLMLSFLLTVVNQEIHVLTYISGMELVLSLCGSCLVEKLEDKEDRLKSNITYKAKWIWKK